MLANVETIERPHKPAANTLHLPPLPAALIEAERRLADISTELKNARADFNCLNLNFSAPDLIRVDGTKFARSGRDFALADLQKRINELEAAEHAARRSLSDAQREFSNEATAKLREPIDTLSAVVAERLAEAEGMLDMLNGMAKEAHKRGVGIRHDVVSRGPSLVRQIESVRRQLQPRQ